MIRQIIRRLIKHQSYSTTKLNKDIESIKGLLATIAIGDIIYVYLALSAVSTHLSPCIQGYYSLYYYYLPTGSPHL